MIPLLLEDGRLCVTEAGGPLVTDGAAASQPSILREDGSYVLREDGSRMLREEAS